MLNKVIDEQLIQQAKKIIDKYDNIVIVSHVSPDGDALGSSLALSHFLNEIGKNVNIIMPDNFPEFLKWLPCSKDIILADRKKELAAELIDNAELIFCLDFNTLSRIEHVAPLVEKAKAKKILIDHHLEPDNFCDISISYPTISSTSELVFRFICRMGMYEYITKKCAECIYTGMMTDTGAFTYNSNQPAIYYIISELLKLGINKDEIYSKVYNDYTETRVRLQGYALYEKMKIYEEYKTSLIFLSLEDRKKFQWKKGDTEGFVNIPLSIENIVFSVFIREEEDYVKVSLRSKGDFPSNKFAAEVFGGGGHLNASGGEYRGSLEDAIKHFEKSLPLFKDLL
ncbi:bifunctional oligoribonuclease/PAP phosphatase NrnA [Bacteroidales bacterium OttesenSCG-928-M11]|nr:bifunctional oligoribonuclease/PAP phosphatase NrnA [Bacteroidales bacterium OttesenSCG-928-M11]